MPPTRLAAVAAAAALFAGAVIAAAPAGATTTVSIDPSQLSLAGSGYDGHSVFTSTGSLEVSTDLAGADDPSAAYATGRFPVDVAMDLLTEPTLSFAGRGTGVIPSMVLLVDFDGDGVPDGTLIGDPTSVPDWWLTPDSLQLVKNRAPMTSSGCGSQWCALLSDWNAAFPDATVVAAGYRLGPGVAGDWQLTSMRVGPNTYQFTNSAPDSSVLHAPDLDADLADDGTAGHIAFDQVGLKVYTGTGPQAYVSQYVDLPTAPALTALGQPSLSWFGNVAAPLPQMVVDPGDGLPRATLTLTPGSRDNWYASAGAPTAVKDRAPSCHAGSPTCDATATAWNGSLAGWQSAFPDATVHAVGFSLSGENATGDVRSLTVGDTTYTFANTRPVAQPSSLSAAYATATAIDLSTGVTDPDPNQTMKYGASPGQHGSVSVSGSTATYTPDKGFAGSDSFVYTVNDGVTQTVQALVHVTVAKAGSKTAVRFTPAHPTTAQKPSAVVHVTSAGGVNAGTVTVRVGGSRFTGRVSNGSATVPLRKLKAGPHKVTASFAGTSTAASSSNSATLRVTRVR